jgi:hypothetical protein
VAEASDYIRGLALCEARRGLTMQWWTAASRDERDAMWAAAEFLADEGKKRKGRRR